MDAVVVRVLPPQQQHCMGNLTADAEIISFLIPPQQPTAQGRKGQDQI